MTPAIQLLLIQIMQLTALLATSTRYHVFADLYEHVSEVSVRIFEPTDDWSKENHPTPIATARAYYERSKWAWISEEEQQRHIQRELEFMRAALHGYLPADHIDNTELPEAA